MSDYKYVKVIRYRNPLLFGETYYDLETKIIKLLERNKKK